MQNYFKKQKNIKYYRDWADFGVVISTVENGFKIDFDQVNPFLAQLQDDGYLVEQGEKYLIPWSSFDELFESQNYSELSVLLKIPPVTEFKPILESSNSLSDHDFSISIGGWISPNGKVRYLENIGPIIKYDDLEERMSPSQWKLFEEVIRFSNRKTEERNELSHRQSWSRIRKYSLAAFAHVDDFLQKSIVLTPERLDIGLRKSKAVSSDSVVEIEPLFHGAPINWLECFDRSKVVQDRYDITTPDGIVQILITPKVRSVLEEIKKLQFRRVAGIRAQAFILNPYSTLGEDAKEVIDPYQFEQARQFSGIKFERFSPLIINDKNGIPINIGLLIETAENTEVTTAEKFWLSDDELTDFINEMDKSISMGYQLCGWNGYDLEILGDTQRHLLELKKAVDRRKRNFHLISYDRVFDLSSYSSRIEGIGEEKPYYSAYIEKKGQTWVPENVSPIIAFTPNDSSNSFGIEATPEILFELKKATEKAIANGETEVNISCLPKPMRLQEALNISGTFDNVFKGIAEGSFEPNHPNDLKVGNTDKKIKHNANLILKANIDTLDYEEKLSDDLKSISKVPELPAALKSDCSLYDHQLIGLAWLQNLFQLRDSKNVRGVVFADDMGLGKTIQILTFMAWVIENKISINPMLVVAPVSLLENWHDEINKFFHKGSMPVLIAYGDSLSELKVPRNQIEQKLRDEIGLVKFLKPNWRGDKKIILTTYETLRDFEFSFALEKWSVMVCDEAQRIKNPAAMVTRSAKKQNADFKIACTGTPVENTLADLWCLFDFVQSGLLGSLNDFGTKYRKPIEAKSEEEIARVNELRNRIAPQIIRRTKEEVKKDLPKKIIVPDCQKLKLSTLQRQLYLSAISDFKKHKDADANPIIKNHLGLIQFFRKVCTDPKRPGYSEHLIEPIDDYKLNSPKFEWLIFQLNQIKVRNEKVIVFCEYRALQRKLKHYIETIFKVFPDIINGDSIATSNNEMSRQKRIKNFQAQPGFGVIILSPLAVGFGVNIQGANHVIHYTRTWNPAKEDQATDRAYRIGQTKDVFVYYPVVNAHDFSTFDVLLDQLLSNKRLLANDMLNGSGDVGLKDFNISSCVPDGEKPFFNVRIDIHEAQKLDARHFEGLAAALWRKKGYSHCYCTPHSNDKGVDVVAISGNSGVLIQTKTSQTENGKLGWDAVKEVVGGEAHYCRKHPNITFQKIGMTNQLFNESAHEQAILNNVQLIDRIHLEKILESVSINLNDIIEFLDIKINESDS